jgi:hypothetical protein
MGRPLNDDLNRPWKLLLPATLAGRVEYILIDPIHSKPIYGARNTLVIALLEWWIARESGVPAEHLPKVPSIVELREKAA